MVEYNLEEFEKWAKEKGKEFGNWDLFIKLLTKRESYWFNYRKNFLIDEFDYLGDWWPHSSKFESAEPYFKLVDEYKAEVDAREEQKKKKKRGIRNKYWYKNRM